MTDSDPFFLRGWQPSCVVCNSRFVTHIQQNPDEHRHQGDFMCSGHATATADPLISSSFFVTRRQRAQPLADKLAAAIESYVDLRVELARMDTTDGPGTIGIHEQGVQIERASTALHAAVSEALQLATEDR